MEEVWKDIAEFPGYQVSDLGRVRNVNMEILKDKIDKDGYRIMRFYKGNQYSRRISRIVLLSFIGFNADKLEADHINRIRDDDRLINLRWVNKYEQGLNKDHKQSNTNQKYIRYIMNKDSYRVYIRLKKIKVFDKSYLTLEEAVAARDEFLAS